MDKLFTYFNKTVLIFRHFSRELVNCLLTVTLIVLVVFLGNQLIRYLNEAAQGNMALLVLGKLLLLEIPYLLALLLPITFFIALLLTQSRVSADHELTVLKACGLTPWQQWQMSAKPALVATFVIALLALWIQPKIALYRNQLLATTNAGASIETIVPGKFQTTAGGNLVSYIEKSTVDHKHLENIFIAERKSKTTDIGSISAQWNLVKAVNGEIITDPKTHAQFIQINQGNRYIGNIGLANYQVMRFDRYLILTQNPTATAVGNDMDALSTKELIGVIKLGKHGSDPVRFAAAELEWRISLPVSCFLLSLLAIRLGEVPPRLGRYARLLPSILILIIYVNLLFVTRAFVGNGSLALFPGIFWVHSVMLLVVIACFIPWQKWQQKIHYKERTA